MGDAAEKARFCWLAAILAAGALGGGAMAQPRAASLTGDGAALQFRRVFVPADRPEDWPIGSEAYVPLRREAFEQLIQRQSRSVPKSPTAALEAATYRASLVGDALVGTGQWKVVVPEGADRILPMSMNLAVGTLRFESDLASADSGGDPPIVGMLASGRQALFVPSSGRLTFDWSRRGEMDPDGERRFELQVPNAASSSLELELPSDQVLRLDRRLAVANPVVEGNRRWWRIELGTQTNLGLVVFPEGAGETARPNVREQLTYEISERGIELAAEFELESQLGLVETLTLDVDPELTVIAVTLAGKPLNWSFTEENAEVARGITVWLNEAVPEKRTLRVLAMGSLVQDRSWALPSVRLQDGFWQNGNLVCRVLQPLGVAKIAGTGCRQVAGGALPEPLAGESFEFETFDPGRRLELTLRSDSSRLRLVTATALSISSREVAAQVHCRGIASGDDVSHLNGQVSDGWLVESITAGAGVEIAQWRVDRSTSPANLHVSFAAGPLAGQPLELHLICRRLDIGLGQPARLGELLPVRFPSCESEGYVALDLAADLQLKSDLELGPRRLTTMPSEIAPWFPAPPGSAIFRLSHRLEDGAIHVEQARPAVAADVSVTAFVSDSVVMEQFQVRCDPQGSPIERVRVQFTSPGALRWNAQTADGLAVTANPLKVNNAHVWEIALAAPRGDPFVLWATNQRPLADNAAVCLASVSGAARQTGTVVIRARPGLGVEIEHQGLQPTPLAAAEGGRDWLVRARYAYDPAAATLSRERIGLRVRRQEPWSPASGVMWRCALASMLTNSGHGWHAMTCYLDNFGLETLRLAVPEHAAVTSVTVDGRRIAAAADNKLEIPLSAAKGPTVVTVEMSTRSSRWGLVAGAKPPFLEPLDNVAVVRREWELAIPPDYEAVGPSERIQGAGSDRIGWRLFGALARGGSDTVFRPWLRASWTELGSSIARDDRARQWLRRLASVAYGAQSASTWGQTFQRWSAEVERMGGTLLLDWPALAAVGIVPANPILTATRTDSPATQATRLLRESELAIVADEKVVLLTSAADACHGVQQGELKTVAAGCVYVPAGEASGESLDQRAASGRYVTVARWTSADMPSRTAPLPKSIRPPAGWNRYTILDPTALGQVRIVDRRRSVTTAWAVSVSLAIVGILVARWRPTWLHPLLGIAVVATLLAPREFSRWTAQATLGLLVAEIWLWLRSMVAPRRSSAATSREETTTTARLTSKAAVGASLLLWAVTGAYPAEGETGAKNPGSTFAVLFPVDADRRPVGDHCHVPQALYESLVGEEAGRDCWLLGDASYRGELRWDSSHERLLLPWIEARYELRTFAPYCRVTMPTFSPDGNLPIEVLLDGEPVAAQSATESGPMAFEVAEAGRHQLEVRVPTQWKREGEARHVELRIPPISTARLDFALPGEAPNVELLASEGALALTNQGRLLSGQLGAIDVLRMKLDDGKATHAPIQWEQWLWLKVQPGAVLLQVKFKFEKPSGMSAFDFDVPRGYRLAPESQQAGSAAPVVQPGPRGQTVRFSLPADRSGPVELAATFAISDFSGVGRLRLPALQGHPGQLARRVLGVTLDPSLLLDETGLGRALSASEWSRGWGSSDQPPQRTWALPLERGSLSIATRPVEPRIETEPHLAVTARRSRLQVDFQARLRVKNAQLFQYELEIPDDLHVERVSVQSGKTEQAARWIKDAGRLSVFLASAPVEEQTLSLAGWLPMSGNTMGLPHITIKGDEQAKPRVSLSRDPRVLVSLQDVRGLAPREQPASDAAAEDRALAEFQAESADYGASLLVRPNNIRFRATQMTRVDRSADRWLTRVECEIETLDGALEEIRFNVPNHWNGPYQCQPECITSLVTTADGRRQLVARLPEPAGKTFRIAIEAITEGTAERFSLPAIVLDGAEALRHVVALPHALPQRQLAWTTVGLRALDAVGESRPPFDPSHTYYEATDAGFEVALGETVDRGELVVHSQAVAIGQESGGERHVVATFDVEPHGRTACTLVVPAGARLVQATVDGAPALLKPQSGRQWRVELRSSRLPQRIEVVTCAPANNGGVVATPTIGEGSPSQIVWTLHRQGAEQVGIGRWSRLDCMLGRLETAEAMLERTLVAAAGDELADAFGRWLARFEESEQALRAVLLGAEAADRRRAETRLAALKQQVESLRRQVSEIAPGAREAPAPEISLASRLSEPCESVSTRCLVTPGTTHAMAVERDRSTSGLARRIGLAVLLIATGTLVYRDGRVLAWIRGRPAVLGMLIGAGCWLWLAASFLGLVIFAVSLASALWRALSEWPAASVARGN